MRQQLTLAEAGSTWIKLGWAGVVATASYGAGVTTVVAEGWQDHANDNPDGMIAKGLTRTTGEIASSSNDMGRDHMLAVKKTISFEARKPDSTDKTDS